MTSPKLSRAMVAALLAFRASDEEHGHRPVGVREGTCIALETRGLIESIPNPNTRSSWWETFLYRRTRVGDDVALEMSLAREEALS